MLSFALAGKTLTVSQAGGFLLLAVGAVFVVGAVETVSAVLAVKDRAKAMLPQATGSRAKHGWIFRL